MITELLVVCVALIVVVPFWFLVLAPAFREMRLCDKELRKCDKEIREFDQVLREMKKQRIGR